MPEQDLFAPEFFVDPSKDYLTEFVGEGKKFQTPQDLARSKAEADAHIARVEAEQKILREELAKRISYEDFIDKIKSQPNNPPEPPVSEPATNVSAIKTEDLERLVEQKLQLQEYRRTAAQNRDIVTNKLVEAYGPNYVQHLRKQTADLNMSEQFVRDLADVNPKALFKLLGIGDKTGDGQHFQAPPRNQQTGFTPSGSVKKGDSYYEDLRKKDPNLYFSAKIQNEMFERVHEMGTEEFYKN